MFVFSVSTEYYLINKLLLSQWQNTNTDIPNCTRISTMRSARRYLSIGIQNVKLGMTLELIPRIPGARGTIPGHTFDITVNIELL